MAHTSEWFEYDWPVNGRKAHICVDTALKDAPRLERTFLLVLTCAAQAASRDRKDALTPREKRHAAALLKKSLSLFPSYHAGSVELSDSIAYYIYAEDISCQKAVTDAFSREKLLFCATECTEEPPWQTYFTFLYPDTAKLWTEENRKRVEFMQKNGDSLTPLRRVSFYAYFPTEQLSMAFAEEARKLGFAIGEPVFAPEQEFPYGVLSYKITSIKKLEIDMLTTKLSRAAEALSGELTYWESPITRQSSPFMR